MIKYILKCKNKHEFESWFSNSNEYEKLKKKNLIECIFCKSQQIEKSIMSPRVLNSETNNQENVVDKKSSPIASKTFKFSSIVGIKICVLFKDIAVLKGKGKLLEMLAE